MAEQDTTKSDVLSEVRERLNTLIYKQAFVAHTVGELLNPQSDAEIGAFHMLHEVTDELRAIEGKLKKI